MSTELSHDFFTSLHKYYASLSHVDCQGIRKNSWNKLLKHGLPNRKSNGFHYVPLHSLYQSIVHRDEKWVPKKEDIIKQVYEECQNSYLVCVNGSFIPELSNLSAIEQQAVILPLQKAWTRYGTFLNKRYQKILDEENDPFALLNLALHGEGLFLYVPPKTVIKTPIQVLLFSNHFQALAPFHFQIFLGPQAQATWVTTSIGPGIQNPLLTTVLEESSHFEHIDLSTFSSQLPNWELSSTRVFLKKQSCFKHLSVTQTTETVRRNIHVTLAGQDAQAILQGLWSLKQTGQAHTNIYVHHQAPSAFSLQKFKGVLSDSSQSSFEGKIYVQPEAQKTNAYQKNQNLLLSSQATAYTRPNLEILADDVKASHGATMSQIDSDHLFYLKSRGLSEENANKLLARGFMEEIVHLIPFTSLRQVVAQHVL